MDILDLEKTADRDCWLEQMANCSWTAGRFLHNVLTENRFHEMYGETSRVLLLTDGTKLVSFCTYAETDDNPQSELTPWMGFVYTDPAYRGQHMMSRLIARVKELARNDGYETLYISTGETGLYEKYGAEYVTNMTDRRGGDSRIYRMDTYGFYGSNGSDAVKAQTKDYPGIGTPKDLYRVLWRLWTRETCTPRLREGWTETDRTLGQCSITAFLAQDIFGGQVWGILRPSGGIHCFNAVGDSVFDLTSEQFSGEKLDYSLLHEQQRQDHFKRQEKKDRYEMLKEALRKETNPQ